MAPRFARLLVFTGLALFGCATAHPLFQQSFRGVGQSTHDRWMRFLVTRYGCDTVLLRGSLVRSGTSPGQPATVDLGVDSRGRRLVIPNPNASASSQNVPPLGSTPCQLAYAFPTDVRAWVTADGIREDWMRGTLVAYEFEGRDPANLRLTLVPLR